MRRLLQLNGPFERGLRPAILSEHGRIPCEHAALDPGVFPGRRRVGCTSYERAAEEVHLIGRVVWTARRL